MTPKPPTASEWVRHGECNDCGYCCAHLGSFDHTIEAASVVDAHFLDLHGYTTNPDGSKHKIIQLMEDCSQHKDDQCAIYDERPLICRHFPETPQGIDGNPCSYWFERTIGKLIDRWGGEGSPYPGRAFHAPD